MSLMRSFVLLFLVLASSLPTPAAAESRLIRYDELSREADRYLTRLRIIQRPADNRPAAAFIRQGQIAAQAGDMRRAISDYETALAIDARDGATWLALSRALAGTLSISDDEKYDLQERATAAAFIAYQRSDAPADKAEALGQLAGTLKERSLFRAALDAYKLSLGLAEVKAIRDAYDQLLAEHGFRILDYTVDADAEAPRLCVQFSDELGKGQVDFAKFVSVDGRDPQTVTARNSELCIEGLLHGQRYQVDIRAGLPSAVEETLAKTAALSIYVRDRSASVRFTGRSYVLPNKGQQGIPLVTVNTDSVDVEIYRVNDRRLADAVQDGDIASQYSGYQIETLKSRSGEAVWHGRMPVRMQLNQEVTTAFPLSDTVPSLKPGVYVMLADATNSTANDWEQKATQWFIVSDLGLTALSGDDGVNVFVRSLETAAGKPGVTVKLVARSNEVLGTLVTDESGHARFEPGLSRGEGGLAPAVLTADTGEGDFAFLDLTTGAFDLSDRGVAGRPAPGPMDGFLYAERGVYRPGESVHLSALVRDRRGDAVAAIPVTLKVFRPDGVEHVSLILPDQGLGGRTTALRLADGAMTGTWRARLYSDPAGDPVAETSFLVEDYVPERLDLVLTPDASFTAGEGGKVKAEGRYLYGPPAANLAVEGDVLVTLSSSGLPGFAGYQFGLSDEQVTPVRATLEGLPDTDDQGVATLPIKLPALQRTTRLLEARLNLRLREPSGRTIERSVTVPIAPEGPVIGIKELFDGNVERGTPARFEITMVGADGQAVSPKGLKWELKRIERTYQWYGRNGYWNYEPVTYTTRVADGIIDTETGPATIERPVDWGSYVLEVSTEDPAGPASSVSFYAGWYGAENADSPEVLQMGLDKASYQPGETARLSIVPEGAGHLVVAVLREGLISYQETDIAEGGGTVDLTVDAGWAPGAYVTAMLYRPMDIAAKRMPSRSIGVAWLSVDPAARSLGVKLELPDKHPSGEPLAVPVTLTGLEPGEEAYVTVAAVDVGILNLTRYKAPEPETWYFGQRRLGTEIRDLYGRLIDGMRAERGVARSGGDEEPQSAMGSPPTQEPVALFSGLLKVDAEGKATATFDLPEFNGTVRFMAVAWSKSRVGHAAADLIVRDPVAMLVSGPRFMILGDVASLILDMHNVEGAAGDYHLVVEGVDEDGTAVAGLDRQVALGTGERKLETMTLKADHMGLASYTVRLTGPGEIDVARAFGVEVKAPANDVHRSTVQTLAAGTGRITVSADVLGDLIPERSRVTVTVGPAAEFDVPGLLAALDRYPYGCAEQTTSRALPLLYLNSVAAEIGVTGEDKARERIEQAIARLFDMQDASGAFGLWGPGSSDMWLSAYVTDFLTRAKEQGYQVPVRPFGLALDRLQNSVAVATDFERGGEAIAYALYVLARNGRAPIGDLRYYADTRIDHFSTGLAQAQIGAALAMYGDTERAERVFRTALDAFEISVSPDGRRDYGSTLRDGAAALTLIAETRSSASDQSRLAHLVAEARLGRTYTSTQENAWMLLAARALIEEGRDIRLKVGGVEQTGTIMRGLGARDLAGGPLTIENSSDRELRAVVTVTGESRVPEPKMASGLAVERSFYTLDGNEVADIGRSEAIVKQNDRFVVVLKVTASDAVSGRVLLVDRLPAGFEIENPRLVEGGSIAALPWLDKTSAPEHAEFRDDRFVAAFDLSGTRSDNAAEKGEATVAYVVRAVTPGEFMLPAATVEDMYRPERFARTDAHSLIIETVR
ncbi:MAG: MG2 domain-containing protein [Hyphomicrobiaceae bacterium]